MNSYSAMSYATTSHATQAIIQHIHDFDKCLPTTAADTTGTLAFAGAIGDAITFKIAPVVPPLFAQSGIHAGLLRQVRGIGTVGYPAGHGSMVPTFEPSVPGSRLLEAGFCPAPASIDGLSPPSKGGGKSDSMPAAAEIPPTVQVTGQCWNARGL